MGKASDSSALANSIDPEVIRQKLGENTIRYQTFSARARLDYTTAKEAQTGIAVYIRMQKDSAIWISVRPLFGIELIRVLITPDSVKMINFMNRTVKLRSADSVEQLMDIPYDFDALQNLIVGNPLFLTDTLQNLLNTGTTIAFSCKKGKLTSSYLVLTNNYLIRQNKLAEADSSGHRYSQEEFSDYKSIGNRYFSTQRNLLIHTNTETKANIKFNRIEFDKPLNFPFPVTDKFEMK